jgi:anti-anti-sigma regulatory factor
VLLASAPDPDHPLRRKPVACDVTPIERINLAAIDRLARLALECRRAGQELRIVGASPELCQLIGLVGLDEVLPLEAER